MEKEWGPLRRYKSRSLEANSMPCFSSSIGSSSLLTCSDRARRLDRESGRQSHMTDARSTRKMAGHSASNSQEKRQQSSQSLVAL